MYVEDEWQVVSNAFRFVQKCFDFTVGRFDQVLRDRHASVLGARRLQFAEKISLL